MSIYAQPGAGHPKDKCFLGVDADGLWLQKDQIQALRFHLKHTSDKSLLHLVDRDGDYCNISNRLGSGGFLVEFSTAKEAPRLEYLSAENATILRKTLREYL